VLWILLDAALALAALGMLLMVLLRLWRQGKTLGRSAAIASERVGAASAGLEAAQATRRVG
jgi:hypothetical protein